MPTISFKIWVGGKFEEGGDTGLFITLVPKVIQYRFLGELYRILIDWLIRLSVQSFNMYCKLKRGYFVYYPWGFTSIYRRLSYPFTSPGKIASRRWN